MAAQEFLQSHWPIRNVVLKNYISIVQYWRRGRGDRSRKPAEQSRLTKMALDENYITETGWNVFLPILCNPASINATQGSNHTLQVLCSYSDDVPQDVEMLLELNSDDDKSRIAATKILQTHRHLDMRPLFDRKLDLLPHVVSRVARALCRVPP